MQQWSGTSPQVLNPETNEDEDDNVVVTDDTNEKQLKRGEVLGDVQGRVWVAEDKSHGVIERV